MKPFDLLDWMFCLGVGIYFLAASAGMAVNIYKKLSKDRDT